MADVLERGDSAARQSLAVHDAGIELKRADGIGNAAAAAIWIG